MNLAARVNRSFFFAAIAAAGYGALVFLYTGFLKLQYPYLIGLGEGPYSQAIAVLSRGIIPWRDINTPPFTLVPYGPVYTVLAALLRHWLDSPFLGGRILTGLSTLAAAVLIYLILRQRCTRRGDAFFSALFFISMPYVRQWGVVVNVDMAGACLDLASYYFWLRFCEQDFKSARFFLIGILLSIAAFFTKASMVAAPGAFLCFLLLRKKFKLAFILFFLQSAVAGFIYWGLNHATQGNYFFHTAYEISRRRFFYEFIFRYWSGALAQAPVLAAAYVLGLWGVLRDEKKSFFGLYLFFILLLTFSLGKQGSDTNYFLPWCMVSSVAVGEVLRRFTSAETGGRILAKKQWLQAAVWLVLLAQTASWVLPEANLVRIQKSYLGSRQFFDRISALIKKTPGDILSEDMSLLVANGREIFYEPFPMGQMGYSGLWNQQLIVEELNRRRFSLAVLYFYAPVLVRNRTFTPEFMKAFNLNYRFVGMTVPPKGVVSLPTNPLYFYAPRDK